MGAYQLKTLERMKKGIMTEAEKKERKKITDKLWASNNKEKIAVNAKKYRDRHLEKSRERTRKWKKDNPSVNASHSMKRHASKLNASPSWANPNYIKLWYKLAEVESNRTGRKVEVDHIVPLQGKVVCGLHCEHNMQLLFKEDNASKGNRMERTA